ncbi:hypothetical protein E0H80_02215 [Acinetobacter sp. ANC 4779]|uniref:hypothetical protein n=1 Tax=Acinetobacter sp. ANC 4779 TaxID=2529848 RepID=UPI00103D871E|nr:hypothetical protein [Acinetobacter sp. ANC 4779]TCB52670.1 hypothetical protein E0H80_02215 [Acinetobacter sp. ANC 4779]
MGVYIELNNFEVSKRLIFVKNTIHYGAPNYKEMINELKKHHEMTGEKIAYILPISGPSTIEEWCRGSKPNYEAGEAFIELWKIFTGKEDQDVPRIKHWSM